MRLQLYLNGKTIPEERACISVLDRGLSYGDGLYETIKALDGVPLFIREHMKRLRAGAKALAFDLKALRRFEDEVAGGVIEALLRKNKLDKGLAYVKLMITRGVDRASHLPTKGIEPTVIILCKPLDAEWIGGLQHKGVSAVFIPDFAPALPQVKSLNYLPSVLAKMKAEKKGAFEAIFVKGGKVLEGSSSNVFIVRNGGIITPPLAALPAPGVLPGVVRALIERLAKRNGIPFKERTVAPAELTASDEAFITNSIINAVPLVKAGSGKIQNGLPGPVTRTMQELLRGAEINYMVNPRHS